MSRALIEVGKQQEVVDDVYFYEGDIGLQELIGEINDLKDFYDEIYLKIKVKGKKGE